MHRVRWREGEREPKEQRRRAGKEGRREGKRNLPFVLTTGSINKYNLTVRFMLNNTGVK